MSGPDDPVWELSQVRHGNLWEMKANHRQTNDEPMLLPYKLVYIFANSNGKKRQHYSLAGILKKTHWWSRELII